MLTLPVGVAYQFIHALYPDPLIFRILKLIRATTNRIIIVMQ